MNSVVAATPALVTIPFPAGQLPATATAVAQGVDAQGRTTYVIIDPSTPLDTVTIVAATDYLSLTESYQDATTTEIGAVECTAAAGDLACSIDGDSVTFSATDVTSLLFAFQKPWNRERPHIEPYHIEPHHIEPHRLKPNRLGPYNHPDGQCIAQDLGVDLRRRFGPVAGISVALNVHRPYRSGVYKTREWKWRGDSPWFAFVLFLKLSSEFYGNQGPPDEAFIDSCPPSGVSVVGTEIYRAD
ncbi:hypothetical protein DFH09DRAFT_1079832 [Mycena vulgaris]|nr:hypothetical protein DFH09DRAFT_1079832 [Mycena vulgaris]